MAYPLPQQGASKVQEQGGVGATSTAVYRHKESGEEAIVQYDPLFGNTQANAFERLGFEFVREAKPEDIKTVADVQPVDSKETAKLQARLVDSVLDQNELLVSELKQQRADRQAQAQDATDISGERARAEAARQATLREQADGEVGVTDSGDFVRTDGLSPKQEETALADGGVPASHSTAVEGPSGPARDGEGPEKPKVPARKSASRKRKTARRKPAAAKAASTPSAESDQTNNGSEVNNG